MLNPYEHEDAAPLTDSVRGTLEDLRDLIEAAREAGLSIVYVNDNHGDWTAGPKEISLYVRHFDVIIPTDAVAHIDRHLAQTAIRMMETNMHAQLASGPDAVLRACRD